MFTVGLLAVMAGRPVIGAPHTLDVLGSGAFASVAFVTANATPWPAA